MTDRIPGKPGQYKATVTTAELEKLQSGEQFVITLVRDDEPSADGTPYNKASVLPDTLAAVICPDIADPTPADALGSLLPLNGGKAMTGDLKMGGFAIKNLATPTENKDAVPKSYADSLGAAHNLLDNTDFSDPVDQRGSGTYDVKGVTIDRWRNVSDDLQVSIADGCVTLTNNASGARYWTQSIRNKMEGKTLTVAVCRDDGTVILASGTKPEGGNSTSSDSDVVSAPSGDGAFNLYLSSEYQTSYAKIRIRVAAGKTVNLKWAAMYEGEYTKETLPRYVPKGYGAELQECMRYYQIRSTNDVAAVDMRPLMVSDAPEITEVTNGYAYSAEI